MKKIFTIFVLFVIAIFCNEKAFAQYGWIAQASGTTNHLQSVCIIDTNTGYVVGSNGTILKTTNGGIDWVAQISGTIYHLRSVYFPEINTGYAVGNSGTILKTTNGGNDWVVQTSGTINPLTEVFFLDSDTGYIVGGNTGISNILKTTNGGIDWVTQISGITEPLQSVYFIDANIGYAISATGGKILNTINGGSNWSTQTSGTNEGLRSIYFTDANTGYIVGDAGTILKTTNGGIDWLAQTIATSYYLNSIYFTDANTGYALASPGGTILKTTNGGGNWSTQISGTTSSLLSIYFNDPNTGYIVGFDGKILKTITGGEIPPTIILNIESKYECFGQNSLFYITTSGFPIYYKWQRNGLDIPNSNNDTLNIMNISLSDTGNYRCIIWNNWGSDTSNLAHLLVVRIDANSGIDKVICNGLNTTLFGAGASNLPIESGNFSYLWSPSIGLTTPNSQTTIAYPDTTTTYAVLITDQLGCFAADMVTVFVQNPFQNEQICLVTVDTIVWKNKIMWEKTLGVGTEYYLVYKENGLNNYNQIGNVVATQPSEFIDLFSVPESHGDKYKISVLDTCGHESELSFYHKTMNLVISSFGSTMGLMWDDYIDESGNYSPYRYYIYRGSSLTNMAILDSVSGSFNSYNDVNVFNVYYYMIGVKKNPPCNVNGSLFSYSNKKDNSSLVEINDLKNSSTKVRINPNPANDKFTIEMVKNGIAEIIDLQGRIIKSVNLQNTKTIINIEELFGGVYTIRIKTDKEIIVRKLIKN